MGTVSSQHVGRLRRVFEQFGAASDQYAGLYWSHFQSALEWPDPELWLEGAVQNGWTVSQMRRQRWQAYGAAEDEDPRDADIIAAEFNEDALPPEELPRDVNVAPFDSAAMLPSGPDLGDGPDFGEEDDLSQGDVSGEDIASESDVPDVVDDQPETADEEPKDAGKASRRERTPAAVGGGEVSPMDFWRSGRVRSARERRAGSGPSEPQGFFKRITSIPLPPWVPVVAIIFVVFGLLGLLFVTRTATGAPRIGVDHWHVPYTFYICGEKQPPAPTWTGSGVHTHADGLIHIHPFTQAEEGAGARLAKWFDYGGGKLDGDEIRMPGSATTYKNGDECADGTTGEVQIFVNGVKLPDYKRFLPKDGDRLRIVFGPPEDQVQLDDRIVLPEGTATRDIEITVDQPVDDDESSTIFTPSSITVNAGEVVRLILNNVDEVSHGLRFAGVDRDYGTNDDFVVVPEGSDAEKADQGDIIEPGGFGFAIIRIDNAGTFEFRDPTVITTTGTIVVKDVAPTETPSPADEFEDEREIRLLDNVFDPEFVVIDAGKRTKIDLLNVGEFVHNLRIAGPDGEYFTDDDITSEDVRPGEEGSMIFEIEVEGTYQFQCDFHPEKTGALTVQ
ncbi:MAG: cupredoxin domain-containing protein [Chloroflexi bacterium]|nr:cupredoxin domain-containing protein [Chloroflexota bacterium]